MFCCWPCAELRIPDVTLPNGALAPSPSLALNINEEQSLPDTIGCPLSKLSICEGAREGDSRNTKGDKRPHLSIQCEALLL